MSGPPSSIGGQKSAKNSSGSSRTKARALARNNLHPAMLSEAPRISSSFNPSFGV